MGNFICIHCNKKIETLIGLRSHSALSHNMTSEDVYLKYVCNGIPPLCECGCGETPKFKSLVKGYWRFVMGHHNRVPGKNNFHKNPETHKKAIETQKKNWKEGKYRRWWEKNDEETLRKIEGIK